MEAWDRLLALSRELSLARSACGLLHWDEETFLPRKGAAWRAEQLAYLTGLAHRRWASPQTGEWISACEEAGFAPDSNEAVNTRWWRREYERAARLPAEFVEECARTESLALGAWRKARADGDFGRFLPHLKTLICQARERAERWGYAERRYDALLDAHEPGLTTAVAGGLFERLAPELSALAKEGREIRAEKGEECLPAGPYPAAAQRGLNREVAEAFGFDFEAGRLDVSAHPFCSSLGPGDCRMTTRYDERDFLVSLYGALHETGHGLYEQGLPAEHWGEPCGRAVSLGVHESQSRLWENHVGRTPEFWEHWLPRAAERFPQLGNTSPGLLWRRANRVTPSFIRVEADEVTYDLHIILRFEAERGLIDGELAAEELPAFWNSRFKELFGLHVPDDRYGCLQDIHWALGAFGYFPAYTLGNLHAAALMEAARRACPGLDRELAAGCYSCLLSWLREQIHRHGMRYDGPDLIRRATGEEASPKPFLAHLRRKLQGLAS